MSMLLLFKGKGEEIERSLEDTGQKELGFAGGGGQMNGEKRNTFQAEDSLIVSDGKFTASVHTQ